MKSSFYEILHMIGRRSLEFLEVGWADESGSGGRSNPRTGFRLQVPKSQVLHFRPGKALQESVNNHQTLKRE
jgi:hypothetical protein